MLTACIETSTCTLQADVLRMGGDILVALTGGAAHIGSVSFVDEAGALQSKEFPHHRDAALGDVFASAIEKKFRCKVVVVCGVHVDDITKPEIHEILHAGKKLLAQVLEMLAA